MYISTPQAAKYCNLVIKTVEERLETTSSGHRHNDLLIAALKLYSLDKYMDPKPKMLLWGQQLGKSRNEIYRLCDWASRKATRKELNFKQGTNKNSYATKLYSLAHKELSSKPGTTSTALAIIYGICHNAYHHNTNKISMSYRQLEEELQIGIGSISRLRPIWGQYISWESNDNQEHGGTFRLKDPKWLSEKFQNTLLEEEAIEEVFQNFHPGANMFSGNKGLWMTYMKIGLGQPLDHRCAKTIKQHLQTLLNDNLITFQNGTYALVGATKPEDVPCYDYRADRIKRNKQQRECFLEYLRLKRERSRIEYMKRHWSVRDRRPFKCGPLFDPITDDSIPG